MDLHDHPTKEEQTGNTQKFDPFFTSQTRQDQNKIAVLLDKHQTYNKLYMLFLAFGVFCHSNNVLLTYIQLKVIKQILIKLKHQIPRV